METQPSPETDTDIRFTNYSYDSVIGKYFAQARFYDSANGRMLAPDPVKGNINPYPYCDSDPVNYNDPTGEIANILVGAGLGGFFGGAAGFIGNAASQLMDGRKINWRRAAGAAANGAVVGAAKGALVGSGVGVLGAFATDFAAGTIGSALEQRISRGRVDLGESLLSGAGNALSEALYGTGPVNSVKDAFIRGARTGAVMSGLENIARAAGLRGAEYGTNPGGGGHSRGTADTTLPRYAGRDPKGMCGASDPFNLSSGLGNGRGYHSGKAHGGAGHSRTGEGGFSLGGFVRDVLTGAVVGGLGSAGFYGAGKAVEELRGSVAGRRGKALAVGDMTFMDADDSFAKYIRRREDVDVNGYYDIIAHGQVDGIVITHNGQRMLVNHRTAARLIQRADGYKGQDIRLLSCNTGAVDDGFAQKLANRLNVKVYAPTNYLWVTPDGEYFVAGMNKYALPNRKNIGKFKLFMPGGNHNGM